MKHSVIAATLLVAFGHQAAHALDLGTLTDQPRAILQTLPAQVGQFTDVFTFSLSAPSFVSASGTSLDLSLMGLNLYGISDFSIVLKGTDGSFKKAATLEASTGNYKIEDLYLTPADYQFEVSGKTIGVAGGSYSFTGLATPVAAVPEPSTYLMMGASLACMGLMVNRRRKHASQA
jgi:hypothetical protein